MGEAALAMPPGPPLTTPVAPSDWGLDDYLPHLCRRVTALDLGLSRALRDADMGRACLLVLLKLRHAPPEGWTVGEVAEAASMQQPTMTKALHRMEAAGRVKRTQDVRDERKRLITLTAKGKADAETAARIAYAHQAAILGKFITLRGGWDLIPGLKAMGPVKV